MAPPIFEEPLFGIYRIITFLSICQTHFFSLVFLLIRTPKTPSLHSYRLSKYIMTVAYTLLAIFNAIELFATDDYADEQLILLNTIFLASLQIYLLSASLILLINTEFFNIRNFFLELSPSVVFGIITYLFLIGGHTAAFEYSLSVFIAYFTYQCIRYSIRFFKEKANTERKIDNYFSAETNSRKLSWITQTFVILLCMCVMAMLSCLIPKVLLVPFSILYFIFYFYLGIKHLNYLYYFHEYESVLIPQPETTDLMVQPNNHSISWEHLENAIQCWEKTRYFTEPGLTIEQVATQLNTNRTYLSNYVNQIKQQSFKEWINQLRIEEAKRLLMDNPDLHVGEIGVQVGLPDKSNFGRLFTRNTGVSPQTWRKQQISQPA